MTMNEPEGILFGIAIILLFGLTFLAGDIAGLFIERQGARKWRMAAEKIGFEFDGEKKRSPSLSKIFLPKLLYPEAEETAFSYVQVMKSISGRVDGLDISINDFTVWDFHTRGPVIYRAVVCTINTGPVELPAPIGMVKIGSVLFYGYGLDKTLKEYSLAHESAFSGSYALFGRHGEPPWIFTPELRRFCVEHRSQIDCLMLQEKNIILVWADKSPDRFPQLLNLATGIATRLLESAPLPTEHT